MESTLQDPFQPKDHFRVWFDGQSFLKSWVDGAIGLHGGDEDVEDPEKDEDGRWDGFDEFGTTQLASHGRMSPRQQDQDG